MKESKTKIGQLYLGIISVNRSQFVACRPSTVAIFRLKTVDRFKQLLQLQLKKVNF